MMKNSRTMQYRPAGIASIEDRLTVSTLPDCLSLITFFFSYYDDSLVKISIQLFLSFPRKAGMTK